jgi:hypothetical protein
MSINVEDLKVAFAEKLLKSSSFDQAFTKACWLAYKAGLAETGKIEVPTVELLTHKGVMTQMPLWSEEDEKRLEVVGQNGNGGEHYDEIS